MLKNHIRPTLGALALPTITRGQVKDLLGVKRAAGLSKDTVRQGLLFLTLADTGMRPGEVFVLRWDDLDMVDREVRVERAVARGGRIKGTKTGASRTVDLSPRMAAALDRHQAAVEADALPAGRRGLATRVPIGGWHAARWHQRGAAIPRAGDPSGPAEVPALRPTPHLRLASAGDERSDHLRRRSARYAKPTMTLVAYAHWIPRGDRALSDGLEALRTSPAQTTRRSAPPAHVQQRRSASEGRGNCLTVLPARSVTQYSGHMGDTSCPLRRRRACPSPTVAVGPSARRNTHPLKNDR